MKALLTFVTLILLLVSCGTKNKDQITFTIDTSTGEILDSDCKELSDNAKLVLLDQVRSSIYPMNMATPIDSSAAKKLTDNYLKSPQDSVEKSVHFYKEELDKMLAIDGITGIRVFFAKYDPSYMTFHSVPQLHPYRSRNTVVLRAVKGNKNIHHNVSRHVAHDYGDICPPYCQIPVYSQNPAAVQKRKNGGKDLVFNFGKY